MENIFLFYNWRDDQRSFHDRKWCISKCMIIADNLFAYLTHFDMANFFKKFDFSFDFHRFYSFVFARGRSW